MPMLADNLQNFIYSSRSCALFVYILLALNSCYLSLFSRSSHCPLSIWRGSFCCFLTRFSVYWSMATTAFWILICFFWVTISLSLWWIVCDKFSVQYVIAGSMKVSMTLFKIMGILWSFKKIILSKYRPE